MILILILILVIIVLFYNLENFTSNNIDNITIVSGYWQVKNKHDNKYDNWFKNTLKINQRYIFFCNSENINYIKNFRNNYETEFIPYTLQQFLVKDKIKDEWIDSYHVPSKELSMIWHEKMNMLKIAKDYDIKNNNSTEFYMWLDAGFCYYRNKTPPSKRLTLKDINSLPHDKIIYTSINNYGKDDTVAGCEFLIHRDLIDKIHNLYYKTLDSCDNCTTDQHVFLTMKEKYPELFFKFSFGWGESLPLLFEKYI